MENFKIVSHVRTYLSERLDIREAQKILARHWKPFMEQPNIMLTDASCYESSMRYPTNVKLLWESVDWCYGQLKLMCKFLKVRTPRTKYLKQKDRYGNYSRKRKKSRKQRKVLTRSLLHLLDKLLSLLDELEQEHAARKTCRTSENPQCRTAKRAGNCQFINGLFTSVWAKRIKY